MTSSEPLPTNVHLVSHPLLAHHLSLLRLESTHAKEFRSLLDSIASILIIDATRDYETGKVAGKAPLREFEGEEISDRIGIVPILRAGLGMVSSTLNLLPISTSVLHIGLFREKISLQPVEYYSKLPSVPNVSQILILDPLIATGGTAIACINMIIDWGIPIEKIKFVAVLASRPGVQQVLAAHPTLQLWVGQIDEELSSPEGYILPGLGDMGDRLFETQ
ncbi:unnamed protein product [Sympodiomycopsis kandeliae]